MYSRILEQIEKYDKITIFRHVRPDGDAMFSALGLYTFLTDNYPDKSIKMAGFEKYDLISRNDNVSDKFIKESLVFVTDTATRQRADDDRFLLGSYIIKIDHHPETDKYGSDNYVDPDASSTCELMTRILFSPTFEKHTISKKTCEYLYCGMVTDSQNFKTSNTTYKTLQLASQLIKKGELIVGDLVSWVTDLDLKKFSLVTYIRSKIQVKDKFAYVIMEQKELKKLNVSSDDAKIHINELTSISDINIFAFAVENEKGTYDCSYRSKRKYVINDVAYEHGGGGHANAAATRNIPYNEQMDIFNILIERSTKDLK